MAFHCRCELVEAECKYPDCFNGRRDKLKEAEVRAEARPVVRCGAPALGGLCCLPRGHNRGKLDIPSNHQAAPRAPAPCPKCAELTAENAAIRSLMDSYNLGGWTDSLMLMKERDALQAKVAEQSAHIAQVETQRDSYFAIIVDLNQAILQQAEHIRFLKEERQEFLSTIDKIGKAVDYDFSGGLAEIVIQRIAELTEELEEWRFTNKIDELGREIERLQTALNKTPKLEISND